MTRTNPAQNAKSAQSDLIAEFPGLLIIHQKIPGRQVGRHRHDEHEFFLPQQGEIQIEHEATRLSAGPGRMMYVPPDIEHSFSSSASGQGERVIVLVSKKLWQTTHAPEFQPMTTPAGALARELIFYLLLHPEAKGAKHFVAALVESFADQLSATQVSVDRASLTHLMGRIQDPRVRSAVEIAAKAEEKVTVEEMAKASGLSSRNLSRLFLHETGASPKEFLVRLQIARAEELLGSSQLTVTEVALEVGYQSLSKFIAAFQRYNGILPGEYKRLKQGLQ